MHVRLSPLAQADLADFKDYLEPRSSQGFSSVMTAIATTFDLLEKFPSIDHRLLNGWSEHKAATSDQKARCCASFEKSKSSRYNIDVVER